MRTPTIAFPSPGALYALATLSVRSAWDDTAGRHLPPAVEPLARVAIAGASLVLAGALMLSHATVETDTGEA